MLDSVVGNGKSSGAYLPILAAKGSFDKGSNRGSQRYIANASPERSISPRDMLNGSPLGLDVSLDAGMINHN